jgi:hypothetical protein
VVAAEARTETPRENGRRKRQRKSRFMDGRFVTYYVTNRLGWRERGGANL